MSCNAYELRPAVCNRHAGQLRQWPQMARRKAMLKPVARKAVAAVGRHVRRNCRADGLWQVVAHADVVSVNRPAGRADPD